MEDLSTAKNKYMYLITDLSIYPSLRTLRAHGAHEYSLSLINLIPSRGMALKLVAMLDALILKDFRKLASAPF